MKRKGFTLIELLAVIVILAIIALIAVPTVMNIINNAQKSAFKDSAYGIIKAGEMYYTDKMMDPEGMTEDKTFEFPDADGLELKGSRPTSGTMVVTKEGKVGLAISNGKYCVKKGTVNEDVIIDENIDNCTIPSILASTNNCIKDTNVTCSNGTEVTVQVNAETSYDFYVIKDTGEELTLIMDKNLGNKIAWNTSGNNADGPLTALEELESQTSGWTNIPTMNYTLNDDGGGNMYSPISITHARARLLTYTEATSLGCNTSSGSCPSYLYTNLSSSDTIEQPYGYWLSAADSYGISYVWIVHYYGNVNSYYVFYSNHFGVRPVITLTKSM